MNPWYPFCVFIGFVVGCGLTYGFRGWIRRQIAKDKAPVLAVINDVHTLLTNEKDKAEGDLKAAIDKARTKLAPYISAAVAKVVAGL